MRIGLIGLGRIGAFHARTLAALPAVDSLVVTDVIPAATERVTAETPAQAAGSPQDVLRAGVDGVVIAAATDAHPELILAAVEAGIPVFCEKPVARAATEAADVVAAVEESGVPVQIGYNRRFDAGFVTARLAVTRGELGWVHTIRSTTMDPAPPPAAYLAGSGGIFRDCSVHDFDILRFVTGREAAEAYATGGTRGDDVFGAIGDASTSAALLTLDDGSLALISNTRYNGRGYDVRLEVHGSADTIAVGWDSHVPVRAVDPGATFPPGPPYHFFMDRFAASYRAELAAFTELVAGTRPSPCTVADAVEAGWIAEACTRSRHEQRPVRLSELR